MISHALVQGQIMAAASPIDHALISLGSTTKSAIVIVVVIVAGLALLKSNHRGVVSIVMSGLFILAFAAAPDGMASLLLGAIDGVTGSKLA